MVIKLSINADIYVIKSNEGKKHLKDDLIPKEVMFL